MEKADGGQRFCLAASFFDRMVGLFSKQIGGEVLVIVPCNSIHTFGMKSAIDIAFIKEDGEVLESYENVPPWRVRKYRSACAVLERRRDPQKTNGCFGGNDYPVWFKKGDKVELCIRK